MNVKLKINTDWIFNWISLLTVPLFQKVRIKTIKIKLHDMPGIIYAVPENRKFKNQPVSAFSII